MTEKKKRTRIGEATAETKELNIKVEERVAENIDNIDQLKNKEDQSTTDSEFYDADGNFMWEAYEATCPSHTRKPNPHIRTRKGDKVYSRESYAQELYDIYSNVDNYDNIKTKVLPGEIHEGTIFGISTEWISVDIGYRELVYVKYSKETPDVQQMSVGEETAVLITNVQPGEHISGSISGGVKQKVFMDLRDGVESGDTAWVGRVSHMIENGGYIVRIQGIDCFMPGSLAGINKLHDFSSIVDTEMYVVPVSFSPERGTLVVSHRKYLQALIPDAIEDLKQNIENEQVGNVTGTAKYGVFVEFNKCLTGMIHSNDLDQETMAKFKAREIKPGDEIRFKVKDIVSHKKITLTQKTEVAHNPWMNINSRYQIPSVVTAKVKTKKDYGLFITIEEGVTGLLHVSELGEDTMSVFRPGDDITVQITRIDEDAMKVFLKMPE